MAFTSVAALAAGADVTAGLVLSAVAEVGTAMSVVGVVTGSKDLMQIGAVMGAVGGIGGAIAGGATAAAGADAVNSFDSGAMQGLINGASGTADSAANIGAANALSDSNYAGADMSQFGGDMTSPVATSSVQGNPLAPADSGVTQTATQATQPITQTPDTSTATTTPDTTQPATYQTGVQEPTGAQAPKTPADDVPNPTDQRLANGTQTTPGGAPENSGNLFSRFSDWANKNKTVLNAGMQLVGGALKGAQEQSMWDQKMQLQRDQFNRANSVGTFAPGIIQKAAA